MLLPTNRIRRVRTRRVRILRRRPAADRVAVPRVTRVAVLRVTRVAVPQVTRAGVPQAVDDLGRVWAYIPRRRTTSRSRRRPCVTAPDAIEAGRS